MTLESRQWLEGGDPPWLSLWGASDPAGSKPEDGDASGPGQDWLSWITGSKDDSDSDLIPAQTPGEKLTPWKMWELNRSWCFFLLPDALHQSVTTFYASYSIMVGFWDYANRDESTRDISLNRMRLCRLPPPSKEESNTIQIQQLWKEDSSPAWELGSLISPTLSR